MEGVSGTVMRRWVMWCGGSKWHCEEEVGECGVEGVSGTVKRRWVNVVWRE